MNSFVGCTCPFRSYNHVHLKSCPRFVPFGCEAIERRAELADRNGPCDLGAERCFVCRELAVGDVIERRRT